MSASDRIELRGLRLVARLGLLPEERSRAQPIEIDVDLEADLGPAGRSDDLDASVDYAAAVDSVRRVVAVGHVDLLETLAERIADALLTLNGVRGTGVRVTKLRPPVDLDLSTAGVWIHRSAPLAGGSRDE